LFTVNSEGFKYEEDPKLGTALHLYDSNELEEANISFEEDDL
jgi:hypothetical protein